MMRIPATTCWSIGFPSTLPSRARVRAAENEKIQSVSPLESAARKSPRIGRIRLHPPRLRLFEEHLLLRPRAAMRRGPLDAIQLGVDGRGEALGFAGGGERGEELPVEDDLAVVAR